MEAFRRYLAAEGARVTRNAFANNLASKVSSRAFGDDLRPLLTPGEKYDVDEAARAVSERLLALL